MRKLIVIGATYFPLGFYAVWSAQWPVHRSSSPTLWEVQVPQISLWAEVITKWNIFSFHFPSHCERRPPWVSPARERRFYLGVRPVPSVHYAKCPAYYAGRPLNCDWFSAAFRVVQCGWQGASHHLDLSGTKTGATPLAAVPNEIGVQPVRPLTGNVCSLASLWPDKQQQKIHPIRFQLYWIGTGRKTRHRRLTAGFSLFVSCKFPSFKTWPSEKNDEISSRDSAGCWTVMNEKCTLTASTFWWLLFWWWLFATAAPLWSCAGASSLFWHQQ